MKRIKVMTVVGTRPEVIRLSRVLSVLDERADHVLVHTGQNYDYGLNGVFFDEMKLSKPKHFLNAAGKGPAETIGNTIARIDPLIVKEKPDAFLVLGDTNSCLAAIAAKRRKIPIFHMEAGNRCFDQRVPEEVNRRIVDHISDMNLTYSAIAREYLLREGLPPDRVIKTGSPMFEVLAHYAKAISRSSVLKRLELLPGRYYVVSCHREENVDSEGGVERLAEILNGAAAADGLPIIMSTHPRTRKRLQERGIKLDRLVKLLDPLGFFDYVRLQKDARAVLSDSGTLTEESSILGFPALNIREAHERPEGMEEGAVIMTGLNPERVFQGLATVTAPRRRGLPVRPIADYHAPDVSEKVFRIILSYTDYVHRFVWHRGVR